MHQDYDQQTFHPVIFPEEYEKPDSSYQADEYPNDDQDDLAQGIEQIPAESVFINWSKSNTPKEFDHQ